MRQTLIGGSAMVAALLVVAACGGDDGGSSSNSDSTAGLSVASVGDAGTVLVDSAGHPVYTNEAEAGTRIKCVGPCAGFWPPVRPSGSVADSLDGIDGTFATTERPDGGKQVTLDGQPLYTFAEDGSDSVEGDGFEDDFRGSHFVWHVVAASESQSSDDGGDNGGGYGGY